MGYSLRKFWSMFERNGWIGNCDENLSNQDYQSYEMRILVNDYHIVRVCYEHDPTVNGDVGIAWIEATNDDNGDHTFMSDYDINCVREAIVLAEENLLKLGIPFESDYKFHDDPCGEKKLRNEIVRKELKVDDYVGSLLDAKSRNDSM